MGTRGQGSQGRSGVGRNTAHLGKLSNPNSRSQTHVGVLWAAFKETLKNSRPGDLNNKNKRKQSRQNRS